MMLCMFNDGRFIRNIAVTPLRGRPDPASCATSSTSRIAQCLRLANKSLFTIVNDVGFVVGSVDDELTKVRFHPRGTGKRSCSDASPNTRSRKRCPKADAVYSHTREPAKDGLGNVSRVVA